MLATWGCTTFPKPTLSLDFLGATSLDSGITFSRGSQATLFDSTGTLVYAKHNLLLQSQTFQTTWATSNATVSADAGTAPDGTATADLLYPATTGTFRILFQGGATANIPWTISVYAKASGMNWLALGTNTNTADCAWFDLSTGVLGTKGANITSHSIANMGNGWYRCIVTFTSTSARSHMIAVVDGDNTSTATASGTNGILIWGAQLNITNMEGGVTSSLSTYYPTTTAAYYAPRFDYNPSTLQPRGLLIEEQRTNSIRNNTGQGAVAGTPGTLPTNWNVGTAAGLTTNVIGTGTEAGVNYVDIQFVGTPTSTAYTLFFESSAQIAALNAQTWASSLWCKIAAGATTNITSIFNNFTIRDSGGAPLVSYRTAMSVSSTWTRYAQAQTISNASTAYVQPGVWLTVTAGAAIDITLRIGLPQLELGAFATSVIPTTTTALTRNADVADMTGTNFSSWYNASQGTLLVQFTTPNPLINSAPTTLNDNTNDNRIGFDTTTTGFGRLIVTTSGVSQVLAGTAGLVAGAVCKMAGAYEVDNFAISKNGGAVSTDTSGTIPTVTQLQIGSRVASLFLNSTIQRIAYYPTRLPNTTLQALTS